MDTKDIMNTARSNKTLLTCVFIFAVLGGFAGTMMGGAALLSNTTLQVTGNALQPQDQTVAGVNWTGVIIIAVAFVLLIVSIRFLNARLKS